MELPIKKPVFTKNDNVQPPKQKSNKAAPTKSNKKPEILLNRNINGILPSTVLSENDKLTIAKKREKKEKLACLAKNIATILAITTLLFFFYMKINTSEKNSFLSKFGINENMGKRESNLRDRSMQLEMSNLEIDSKINKVKIKIKNKNYTLFSDNIKKIRDTQINWFDKISDEGVISIGIIDGVARISEYINDNGYKDNNDIINGRYGKVEISNVSANRESVSFSAVITQILGRIIFMDIEFVEVLNSFPIYKNGKHLTSFSREKNEDGDYSTSFSMNLDIQMPEDEDLNDDRFIDYLNWFKNTYPDLQINDYKKINK